MVDFCGIGCEVDAETERIIGSADGKFDFTLKGIGMFGAEGYCGSHKPLITCGLGLQ
jgi:hypothetical protein